MIPAALGLLLSTLVHLGPEVPVGTRISGAAASAQTSPSAAWNGHAGLMVWIDQRGTYPADRPPRNIAPQMLRVSPMRADGSLVNPEGTALFPAFTAHIAANGTSFMLAYASNSGVYTVPLNESGATDGVTTKMLDGWFDYDIVSNQHTFLFVATLPGTNEFETVGLQPSGVPFAVKTFSSGIFVVPPRDHHDQRRLRDRVPHRALSRLFAGNSSGSDGRRFRDDRRRDRRRSRPRSGDVARSKRRSADAFGAHYRGRQNDDRQPRHEGAHTANGHRFTGGRPARADSLGRTKLPRHVAGDTAGLQRRDAMESDSRLAGECRARRRAGRDRADLSNRSRSSRARPTASLRPGPRSTMSCAARSCRMPISSRNPKHRLQMCSACTRNPRRHRLRTASDHCASGAKARSTRTSCWRSVTGRSTSLRRRSAMYAIHRSPPAAM